jgi:ribosomal protein L11 methyltransferase
MQIIKVIITSDAQLTETISDYLIGVLDAAVEYRVDEDQQIHLLHAFVIAESWLDAERISLEEQILHYIEEMADIFDVATPVIESEIISDQDWSANWKTYFKPFEIIEGLVIAPSWQPYDPGEKERVITMDPGMAFGTGHHATTRLCLELIRSEADQFRYGSVLDVGTGTGILAMASALMGAETVLGIDNDDEAVAAAKKNVRMNKLQDRIHISNTPLADVSAVYPLVVANIVHDVLRALADDLKKAISPGGVLIVSGLMYGEQTSSMINCFQKIGFDLIQEKQDGEWGALVFKNEGHI